MLKVSDLKINTKTRNSNVFYVNKETGIRVRIQNISTIKPIAKPGIPTKTVRFVTVQDINGICFRMDREDFRRQYEVI